MQELSKNNGLVYKAIEDVFQVKYFIDFYQRDYTWNPDNVVTLVEDIYHRFDLKYAVSDEIKSSFIKEKYKWYYLNTYIINKQDSRTCIVDGQQRFSTLTLILIKLYHLAKGKGLNDTRVESIKSLIYKASSKGLEFWMGGDDRSKTLEDIFKCQKNTDLKRELSLSDSYLYHNYIVVNKCLDEKFSHTDSHYLECFILYFLTNIRLVEIEVKESDDVAMVFEVINAKGQKLKSHEILKAQLLSQINKNEVTKYLNLWNKACSNLQKSGLKYPNIDNEIDAFFTYFFRGKYSETTTEIQNFKDYHKTIFSRDWQKRLPFKHDEKFVKRFIENDFLYYSEKIVKLIESTLDTNRHIYYNLKINDLTSLYLVIFSALKFNDKLYDEKITLLAKLVDRHYATLRLQGCYDSNSFNRLITSIVLKIRDNDNLEEIKSTFDVQLLEHINEVKDSDVSEFFTYSYFKNIKVSGSNKKFIRYLLARVEEFMCNSMQFDNFVGYSSLCAGKKYHIEHILANNEENYMLFGSEEYLKEQRDRLGGLLLLRKGDNGKSSDEIYSNKLKTYTNDTYFARSLTKNFYHNNSGLEKFRDEFPNILFKHINNFDEKALNERHELFFTICKQIWDE